MCLRHTISIRHDHAALLNRLPSLHETIPRDAHQLKNLEVVRLKVIRLDYIPPQLPRLAAQVLRWVLDCHRQNSRHRQIVSRIAGSSIKNRIPKLCNAHNRRLPRFLANRVRSYWPPPVRPVDVAGRGRNGLDRGSHTFFEAVRTVSRAEAIHPRKPPVAAMGSPVPCYLTPPAARIMAIAPARTGSGSVAQASSTSANSG